MKVKNIQVGLITCSNMEKIVFIKESSFFKKFIKFALKDNDEEYKCVFSRKKYWLKRDQLEPLTFFMDIDQIRIGVSKRNLRDFYKEKESEMRKVLVKKGKSKIGFQ